jgi:hypothetical protein
VFKFDFGFDWKGLVGSQENIVIQVHEHDRSTTFSFGLKDCSKG